MDPRRPKKENRAEIVLFFGVRVNLSVTSIAKSTLRARLRIYNARWTERGGPPGANLLNQPVPPILYILSPTTTTATGNLPPPPHRIPSGPISITPSEPPGPTKFPRNPARAEIRREGAPSRQRPKETARDAIQWQYHACIKGTSRGTRGKLIGKNNNVFLSRAKTPSQTLHSTSTNTQPSFGYPFPSNHKPLLKPPIPPFTYPFPSLPFPPNLPSLPNIPFAYPPPQPSSLIPLPPSRSTPLPNIPFAYPPTPSGYPTLPFAYPPPPPDLPHYPTYPSHTLHPPPPLQIYPHYHIPSHIPPPLPFPFPSTPPLRTLPSLPTAGHVTADRAAPELGQRGQPQPDFLTSRAAQVLAHSRSAILFIRLLCPFVCLLACSMLRFGECAVSGRRLIWGWGTRGQSKQGQRRIERREKYSNVFIKATDGDADGSLRAENCSRLPRLGQRALRRPS
ncbi:hypothetical protein C7M84_022039 [Penaeus vannamei]|uniref:Uncharacterized protein n=1 Tax=Penaeus vannamei TaxID=6689 RepID=A0A3R7PWD5_PENVA|nr:hypothetical protein C7M84_022039 [Penaeus vannamei]